MGELIRRSGFDIVAVSLFITFLAALVGKKFHVLITDEASLPTDWVQLATSDLFFLSLYDYDCEK